MWGFLYARRFSSDTGATVPRAASAPGLLARPGTAEQGAAAGCTILVLSFTYCHKISVPSSAEVIVTIF